MRWRILQPDLLHGTAAQTAGRAGGQPASGQEQAGQAGMRGRPGQAGEARRLAISAGARQATPGCQGLLSNASQG